MADATETEELSDIYFDTLTYRNYEIDDLLKDERTYTDTELAKKIDSSLTGTPSGMATLDAEGNVPPVELPFANNTEAYEGVNTDLVISPATLKYAVDVGTIPADAYGTANGVAPLGSDLKINPIYLNTAPQVDTFVVETLAERNALYPVSLGDRCIVTNDPSDTGGDVNGEWVVAVEEVPGISDPVWEHLPNLSAVSSVNGQTGIVEILTTQQGDTNETNITTWALAVDGNTNDIDNLTTRVATNETDIEDLQAEGIVLAEGVATNLAAINTNISAINTNISDISTIDTRLTNVESAVTFPPLYQYDKVVNNTITDDQWQQTGFLTVVDVPVGTFEFKFSMQWQIDSITSSAFFRYSRDGGNTWVETQKESKDATDKNLTTYGFPFENDTVQTLTFETQARKENANNNLIMLFNNIVLERKM